MITETVELFGLPGAGKSTVARAVAEQLRKASCQTAESADLGRSRQPGTKRHLVLRRPYFALRSMSAALRFTRSLGHDHTRALQQAAWLTMREFYLERFRAVTPHDVLLLDEWVLQSIWSMTALCPGYNGRVPEEVIDACTRVNPRLYVFISCDPELALQRIRARPPSTSKFDHMDEAETRFYLNNGHAWGEKMAGHVRARWPQSFLQFEAGDGVEQKARAIVDFILTKRKSS